MVYTAAVRVTADHIFCGVMLLCVQQDAEHECGGLDIHSRGRHFSEWADHQ